MSLIERKNLVQSAGIIKKQLEIEKLAKEKSRAENNKNNPASILPNQPQISVVSDYEDEGSPAELWKRARGQSPNS